MNQKRKIAQKSKRIQRRKKTRYMKNRFKVKELKEEKNRV